MKWHKLFPARFFAIRSDFSVVEFLRQDLLPTKAEKEFTTTHPVLGPLKFMTRHLPDENPDCYVANESLSKPTRSTLLKTLHIPKAKTLRTTKGAAEIKPPAPAGESIAQLHANASELSEQMKLAAAENHQRYLKEIRTPPPPVPKKLPLPAETPTPRVQLCEYNRDEPPLSAKTQYWKSPESDFAYPLDEPRIIPRPLSSRRNLHDPPRWFNPEPTTATQVMPDSSRAFALTAPAVPVMTRDPMSARGVARGISALPEDFDFGEIDTGVPETRGIVLMNTGTRPIHFAFAQIVDPSVRLLSIPSVVYPGLKATIRVQIECGTPQRIKSALRMITPGFEMVFPVRADVVAGASEPEPLIEPTIPAQISIVQTPEDDSTRRPSS
jgi:hypothetical protein